MILFSRDLEATLAAVRAAGGTIVEQPYGFPGGRRLHFADQVDVAVAEKW